MYLKCLERKGLKNPFCSLSHSWNHFIRKVFFDPLPRPSSLLTLSECSHPLPHGPGQYFNFCNFLFQQILKYTRIFSYRPDAHLQQSNNCSTFASSIPFPALSAFRFVEIKPGRNDISCLNTSVCMSFKITNFCYSHSPGLGFPQRRPETRACMPAGIWGSDPKEGCGAEKGGTGRRESQSKDAPVGTWVWCCWDDSEEP